jgi:hypothetical protein
MSSAVDGQVLYGKFGDKDREYRVASSSTSDRIRIYATWRGKPTMIAFVDNASTNEPSPAWEGGWSQFSQEWRKAITTEACRVYREALRRGSRACSG